VCRWLGGVEEGVARPDIQDIRAPQVRVLEEVRMLRVDLEWVHVVELLKVEH
jgi:hypothetical protein